MQTYLVHMRDPMTLIRKQGMKGFMSFQLFIGTPTITFLSAPLVWLLWLGVIVAPDEVHQGWQYQGLGIIALMNMVLGLGMPFICAAYASFQNGWKEMGLGIALFPFYWVLHSIASFRALWHLITKPSEWEKTEHGISQYTQGIKKAT